MRYSVKKVKGRQIYLVMRRFKDGFTMPVREFRLLKDAESYCRVLAAPRVAVTGA